MEEVRGAPSENMGIDAREAGAGTDAEIDPGAGAPEPAAREEGRECEKYHEWQTPPERALSAVDT